MVLTFSRGDIDSVSNPEKYYIATIVPGMNLTMQHRLI